MKTYGIDEIYLGGAAAQRARYQELARRHAELFGPGEVEYFSAPGRTEIAGNHTDHNHGRVLAAAVNLDTVAAVRKNDTGIITLYSEGFGEPFVVDTADLSRREGELGTSAALIRGVAARLSELGYDAGGFDAAVVSSVYKGSGLSSSAAFEVLICAILDSLYSGGRVDPKERAKIARYAENEYFGKPCGLMDQMASSVGDLVYIDFGPDEPEVARKVFDFSDYGYALAVVSAGGDHGNLTAEYASMPAEMRMVARALGREVLGEVDPATLKKGIPALKGRVPDRAILRALHFIDENRRVKELVAELDAGNLTGFFDGIIESGESSWKLLQNIYVPGSGNQEMALALELSRRLLHGHGAWRIHGGGFAGTILAFVPIDMLQKYRAEMNAVFGEGAVTELSIRPAGAARVAP